MATPVRNARSLQAAGYLPRRPEETLLYGAVADHLETFLRRARGRERTVPRFVERELRKFLDCGIAANGFLRVRCEDCALERLVPFSCKGRAFCPSCGGRRMADTAAHLVDRVLPRVSVRQWVLSLPVPLRYRMAYDARLTGEVLRLFVRSVFASLRRRAGRRGRSVELRCGAVTFVQRFGDALNLNVHFHTLALDGTFDAAEGMRFRPLPPPGDDEVAHVAQRVARGLLRLLERRGLGPEADPDQADPLSVEQPLLAALYAASVRGRVATGPRAGQGVLRFGDRVDPDRIPETTGNAPRCVSIEGLSVHADVAVPANDRARLERLCRYVARPPLATERLERGPDGRLIYRLRHRWRDGTTQMAFEPVELLERLAALVPPPRFNMVRYHGVLGPAAKQRRIVVAQADGRPLVTGCRHEGQAVDGSREQGGSDTGADGGGAQEPSPRRYAWAELLRRVFAIDALDCPRCSGAMRILAAIHPPENARAILQCLGLPIRAPPIAPPAGPDHEFDEL